MKLKHWLESLGRGVSKRVKNSTTHQQQTATATMSTTRDSSSRGRVISCTATPTFRNNFLKNSQRDDNEEENINSNDEDEEQHYACRSELLAGSSAANFNFTTGTNKKHNLMDNTSRCNDEELITRANNDVINSSSSNNDVLLLRRRGSWRPSTTTQVAQPPPERRDNSATTAQRGSGSGSQIKQCASFSTARGSSSWLQQRQQQQRPSVTQLHETINNQILRRESHRQLLISAADGGGNNNVEQHYSTSTKNSHHFTESQQHVGGERRSGAAQHLSRRQKSELTSQQHLPQTPTNQSNYETSSCTTVAMNNFHHIAQNVYNNKAQCFHNNQPSASHSTSNNTSRHMSSFSSGSGSVAAHAKNNQSILTPARAIESGVRQQLPKNSQQQQEEQPSRRIRIRTNPWLRTASVNSRNGALASNTTTPTNTTTTNLNPNTSHQSDTQHEHSKPNPSTSSRKTLSYNTHADDCTTICSCDSLCSAANGNSSNSSSAASTPVAQQTRRNRTAEKYYIPNRSNKPTASKNDSRSSSRASSAATSSHRSSTNCSTTTASSSDHESWTFSTNVPPPPPPIVSLPPNYPPPSLPSVLVPPQSPSLSSIASDNQRANAVVRQIERVFAAGKSIDDGVAENITASSGRNRKLRTRAERAADSIFAKRNGGGGGAQHKTGPIYAEPRPVLINVGSLYSESRDARKPRRTTVSPRHLLNNPYASTHVGTINLSHSPVYAVPTTVLQPHQQQLPNHNLLMAAACSTTRVSPSDSGRFSSAATTAVGASVRNQYGRDTIERFETDSGHGSKTLSSLESPSSLTDAATTVSSTMVTTTPQDNDKQNCLLQIIEARNHSSTIEKFNFEHQQQHCGNAAGLLPFFDDDVENDFVETAYYQNKNRILEDEDDADREHLLRTQLDQLRFKRMLLEEELNGMGYAVPNIQPAHVVPPPPPRRTTSRITTDDNDDHWRNNNAGNLSFHDSMRQQQQDQRNLIQSLAQLKKQMQVQNVRLSDGLSRCRAAGGNNWSPLKLQESSAHNNYQQVQNNNDPSISLWDEEDYAENEDAAGTTSEFAQHLRSYSDSDAQPKFHDAASMLSTRCTSARWGEAADDGSMLPRDATDAFITKPLRLYSTDDVLCRERYLLDSSGRYANDPHGSITYEMVANTKESIC